MKFRRYVVKGTKGPELMVCGECDKANEAFFAAGGTGKRKVPMLVAGRPEDQPCEHLAEYVRGLLRADMLKSPPRA